MTNRLLFNVNDQSAMRYNAMDWVATGQAALRLHHEPLEASDPEPPIGGDTEPPIGYAPEPPIGK